MSGGEEGRERNDRETRDILFKKEISKRLKRKMQDTVTHDEGLQWGGRQFRQRKKERRASATAQKS